LIEKKEAISLQFCSNSSYSYRSKVHDTTIPRTISDEPARYSAIRQFQEELTERGEEKQEKMERSTSMARNPGRGEGLELEEE
jgi:hypothetical protein